MKNQLLWRVGVVVNYIPFIKTDPGAIIYNIAHSNVIKRVKFLWRIHNTKIIKINKMSSKSNKMFKKNESKLHTHGRADG